MDFIALILGYLFGSIPTARIVARVSTGEAEALGGGNVGTLNTIRQVGLWPGLVVAFFDIAKGAAAVLAAKYLIGADDVFVLGAGVMAVAGHNWMVWLGFKGGKGMAAATGAIIAASFAYGHGGIPVYFITLILFVWALRRNLVLGNAVGLLALPAITWMATASWTATLMAGALVGVIVIKYIPDAIADYRRRGWGALGLDEIKPRKR
ncbi:glycerol-3-phosphate acyltransferase [Dehalogenimonas sp. THU2]|uniref:glycerol-3-phosphate acyltransferase n=1 Tax=Dehalogenimonas sp. THU2 TaxID=3151121 RepID=UPI003218537D